MRQGSDKYNEHSHAGHVFLLHNLHQDIVTHCGVCQMLTA